MISQMAHPSININQMYNLNTELNDLRTDHNLVEMSRSDDQNDVYVGRLEVVGDV